jgi:hypothetical protein
MIVSSRSRAHRRGFADADFLPDEILNEAGQLLLRRRALPRAREARRELPDARLGDDDPARVTSGRVPPPEPDAEERGPEEQEMEKGLAEKPGDRPYHRQDRQLNSVDSQRNPERLVEGSKSERREARHIVG